MREVSPLPILCSACGPREEEEEEEDGCPDLRRTDGLAKVRHSPQQALWSFVPKDGIHR